MMMINLCPILVDFLIHLNSSVAKVDRWQVYFAGYGFLTRTMKNLLHDLKISAKIDFNREKKQLNSQYHIARVSRKNATEFTQQILLTNINERYADW